MNTTDCLAFLATSCVFFAIVCGHALSNSVSEPLQWERQKITRSKREDTRAMTMSGFFPNGGMSAFATSGDWGQWSRGRGSHRPTVFPGQGWNNAQNTPHIQPQNIPQTQEENIPESGETDFKENDHTSQPVNKEDPKPIFNKKPKKKPTHHKDKSSEESDENVPVSHGYSGGGNAAASFNAWFPIMLGMFPPSQESIDAYSGSSRKSHPYTTVVANSVSHGPGGVASSHAVAYGGQPESHAQHH